MLKLSRAPRRAALAWTLLSALATSAVLSGPAAAGDHRAPIWDGFYLGLHGGVSWADFDTNGFESFDLTRPTGGVHLGYNLLVGGLLAGLEGDVNYGRSAIDTSAGPGRAVSIDTDWSGSLRARLGAAFGPALVYATAGWAWADVQVVETSDTGARQRRDGTADGPVYGLGAEISVLPMLSLRLEGLRTDYGTRKINAVTSATRLRDIEYTDTVLRAGATLHLP